MKRKKTMALLAAMALSAGSIYSIAPAHYLAGSYVYADTQTQTVDLLSSIFSKVKNASDLSNSERIIILNKIKKDSGNGVNILSSFFNSMPASISGETKEQFTKVALGISSWINSLSSNDINILATQPVTDPAFIKLNNDLVSSLESGEKLTLDQINSLKSKLDYINKKLDELVFEILTDAKLSDGTSGIGPNAGNIVLLVFGAQTFLSDAYKPYFTADTLNSVAKTIANSYNSETDVTVKAALKKLYIDYSIYPKTNSNNNSNNQSSPSSDTSTASTGQGSNTGSDKTPGTSNNQTGTAGASTNSGDNATPKNDAPSYQVNQNSVTVDIQTKAGVAASTIDKDAFANALSKISSNDKAVSTITLDASKVTNLDSYKESTMTVPAEALKALSDNKIANVAFNLPTAQIVIPSAVIDSKATLTVDLTKNFVSDTKRVLKKAQGLKGGTSSILGSYDFKLKSGDKLVSKFTSPVQITLNVDAKKADKSLTAVYYINDKGNISYVGGKYANGAISFSTPHFSTYAVMNYTKKFTDVSKHWINAQDKYLDKAVSRLMINDNINGKFSPDTVITRGEFVYMLSKALKLDNENLDTKNVKFKDVADNSYYADQVKLAVAAGLVNGVSKDKFAPNDKLTREQLATLIMKAYKLKASNDALNKDAKASGNANAFADLGKVSSYAKEYVTTAQKLGILSGAKDKNGKLMFNPKNNLTRAEGVKAIITTVEKLGM